MKNTIKIDESKKKILIIGANGFLGSNFLKLLEEEHLSRQSFSFIAADLENTHIDPKIPYCNIDITNKENTTEKILEISPDVIILTAAMTDVDQCEINKELATRINTNGPINVVKTCEKINCKLVCISTDFVFDGKLEGRYYTEEDLPNPLSHYAKTKYNAEVAIKNSSINYLICRSAVLYGWNPNKLNFITWILEKLRKNEELSVVTNQINNPTFVPNLAELILKLIEKSACGIYHTAGDIPMTRYEMALKCAGVFEYDHNLIRPIETFEQYAIRPKNAGLDITKLKNLIGSELPILSLEEGLKIMRR